jgi:uncharacterized lipoprotein YddW (UPF0748 family)
MKKIFYIFLSCLSLFSLLTASEQNELRGAWIAWAGTNIPSRALIAETMEALADANFNIVYVDVWRYGYPYFRSKVFEAHTSLLTDPNVETNLAPERDVLAEMIVEAHRVGLEVDAWFEAGFNAGTYTSSPIYQAHPEWLAKTQNGSIANYGQAGPSCIHVLPEVQNFLIELTQEVVQNYDIDGVEFDRIRYPQLDCGYDNYTKELYKSEKGSYPPSSVSDAIWIRWRADKLTEFVAEMYDSIKILNPDVTVSNAPLPWGYEQFCQDYAPWIDNGYLDIVTPQMYMTSNTDYTWRMNTELAKISSDSLMYPGISTVANSNYIQPSEMVAQITTTRNAGLKGNVIWYHAELMYNTNNYLDYLKTHVYQNKADIPYRSPDWRPEALIIDIDSSAVTKTGDWQIYTGTNVYEYYNDSHCYIASAGSTATVVYTADIPENAWYTVYAFQNIPKSMASATDISAFTVHSDTGNVSGSINQKTAGNAGRWEDLGDHYFEAGTDKNILTIATPGSGSGYTFVDAVMLIRSRNPFHGEEYVYTSIENEIDLPKRSYLKQNYPNPFNPYTAITYQLEVDSDIELSIYDLKGRKIKTLINKYSTAGEYTIPFNAKDMSSGIYIYTMSINGNRTEMKKMTLVK